jgi:hypothetical protein
MPSQTLDRRAAAHAASLRLLAAALWLAVLLAAFEGPLRYGLHLLGLDALIFARDALLALALAAFVVTRTGGNALPASLGVFVLLGAVHALVGYANLRDPVAALYGLKIFLPALCGFLAAEAFFRPGPKLLALIALAWLATLTGAALDQWWLDYPWVGVNVELAGIEVALGRDWQSGAVERVGGLTRSSINLAIVMPLLSVLLLGALKPPLLRFAVGLATLAVLVWTTQKGAILGWALMLLALLLSSRRFAVPLKLGVVAATVLMVFAPTVLIYFDMPRDRGVFSFESLIERVEWMWPAAWAWIDRFPPLLGVGLGGIGGSQRFFAPADFNPADNLFIYLYANFGIAALAYLAGAVWLAVGARLQDFERDRMVLASLCFLMMYGLVISLVEDQVASLWIGACLGWLARLQPRERGAPWGWHGANVARANLAGAKAA